MEYIKFEKKIFFEGYHAVPKIPKILTANDLSRMTPPHCDAFNDTNDQFCADRLH